MSRSLSFLRRGFLGIVFVGSLGFGASQAYGSTEWSQTLPGTCPDMEVAYRYPPCAEFCGGYAGYCAEGGYCYCRPR